MSVVPAEWVENAVEAIQAEYPAWTVQPYNGSLDVESGASPLVTVAIEGYAVQPDEDRMTGDTYARATAVCYLVYPRETRDSYNEGLAAASGLLSFLRISAFHEKADRVIPSGVSFIPEEIGGVPVLHRSVWAIMADVVMILDSDVGDSDVFDWDVVGQPIRGVNIEVDTDG